jgi:hypothetical protein
MRRAERAEGAGLRKICAGAICPGGLARAGSLRHWRVAWTLLAFIENGALSTFIRETPTVFVFPAILTLHTIGMGSWPAAASRSTCGSRLCTEDGAGADWPVLSRALAGLVVNAVSGILLLIAIPPRRSPTRSSMASFC